MKTHLLFVALISLGYRAELDFSAEQRKTRASIDDLLPQALKDGNPVPEVIATLEKLEAQEKSLELLSRQAAKQKHLAAIPEHERFAVEFGTSKSQERDLSKFSILEACNIANSDGKVEGILRELREEAQKELHASGVMANVSGVAIPRLAMEFAKHRAAVRRYQNATQSVTGTNLGSQFVQTDVRGDLTQLSSLIAGPIMEQAGAFVLRGLVGNILIPVIAPAGAITTKAENASANASDHATTSITLTPKRLPVYVDISDQLVMQSSPDVEALILKLLLDRVNFTKDQYCIHGTASTTVPSGIVTTSGIGSVAGGTNGLAPTNDHIIDLETAVANANANGNLYLTNSRVRGKLKKTAIESGYPDKVWAKDNTLNGYRSLVSNLVSNTLTKGSSSGVCSAIIFGDFSQYLMAYWGGMMLEKPRDKTAAITGTGTLVVTEFFDGAVLQPAAFAAMLDALTA
jgi:HK97 family phage major capsid protein